MWHVRTCRTKVSFNFHVFFLFVFDSGPCELILTLHKNPQAPMEKTCEHELTFSLMRQSECEVTEKKTGSNNGMASTVGGSRTWICFYTVLLFYLCWWWRGWGQQHQTVCHSVKLLARVRILLHSFFQDAGVIQPLLIQWRCCTLATGGLHTVPCHELI